MSTELHDQLHDLAGEAPVPASGSSADLWADLWRAGKRRHRRRTAGVASSVILLAGVVGAGLSLPTPHEPMPVTPTPSNLHLPDHAYRPSPWSKGTSDLGEIGPLAVIGSADRWEPEGVFGKRQTTGLYGVSAVDGTVRFLDLGLPAGYQEPWDGPSTALSPDGTKVGFLLEKREPGAPNGTVPVGWAVYDSVSGQVRELRDPRAPRISADFGDLSFSADSKYLVTSYSRAEDAGAWRKHSLVTWDVATGARVVAEGEGPYWSPNVGTAPTGILWARKFDVFRFDPATGERSSFVLPKAVVYASVGPDDRAFAYIGGAWTPGPDGGINGTTWRLYVGPDRAHLTEVATRDGELGYVVGWKDPEHVVVSGWGPQVMTVDVRTGAVERWRMVDRNSMAGVAGGLVANAVVPGIKPPSAEDPRTWWRRAGYAGLPLTVLLGYRAWRRRG